MTAQILKSTPLRTSPNGVDLRGYSNESQSRQPQALAAVWAAIDVGHLAKTYVALRCALWPARSALPTAASALRLEGR